MTRPARPGELGADERLLDLLGTRAGIDVDGPANAGPDHELARLLAALATLSDRPLQRPGQAPEARRAGRLSRRAVGLVVASSLALTGATAAAAADRSPGSSALEVTPVAAQPTPGAQGSPSPDQPSRADLAPALLPRVSRDAVRRPTAAGAPAAAPPAQAEALPEPATTSLPPPRPAAIPNAAQSMGPAAAVTSVTAAHPRTPRTTSTEPAGPGAVRRSGWAGSGTGTTHSAARSAPPPDGAGSADTPRPARGWRDRYDTAQRPGSTPHSRSARHDRHVD